MDDIFEDRVVGQAIDAMVHQDKDDGALAILDGAQVIAWRTVEAVPAAVVATDKSGGIDRRGHSLAARLHGELIVHQKSGVCRIVHLDEASMVEFLFERAGN